jgi:phosphate acetyltransferase
MTCPKVAIICAIEEINSRMVCTTDAASLCKMADRGQITGAILDGPLALDNAISKEAARIKKIECNSSINPGVYALGSAPERRGHPQSTRLKFRSRG